MLRDINKTIQTKKKQENFGDPSKKKKKVIKLTNNMKILLC